MRDGYDFSQGTKNPYSKESPAPVTRLTIFSGLPGTGKTSIARELAVKMKAVFLRIDSVEQALIDSGLIKSGDDIGPAGYMVAQALAADNLCVGLSVITDPVNPFAVTRDAWRDVAIKCGVKYLEIEVVCSDQEEHRRRIETRQPDIPGLKLPTWNEVINREYHPWNRNRLVIDSSKQSVEQAVNLILSHEGK